MDISYLSDHPEYIDALASWLHAQWGWFTPGSTLESRRASLEQSSDRDRLPVTVVAHEGGRPWARPPFARRTWTRAQR